MDSKQQESLYNYLIKLAAWESLRSWRFIFFPPTLLKKVDCGKGYDILMIFIRLHELHGYNCPKEIRIILPSQGTKNVSVICFASIAVGFHYMVTVDEWLRENGCVCTDTDCARQQAPAWITAVCNALSSSLLLEDRVHLEVRKLTIFSVVQVKLKDPEIHESIACELHGGDLDISVAFAATFENLCRMGKMMEGWKKGKNCCLPYLIFKRGEKG